jgi:hypothetical protein
MEGAGEELRHVLAQEGQRLIGARDVVAKSLAAKRGVKFASQGEASVLPPLGFGFRPA